jgi:hypothetical protein
MENEIKSIISLGGKQAADPNLTTSDFILLRKNVRSEIRTKIKSRQFTECPPC